MCGIVGYVGNKNAQEVILQGLEKLEYRGYDSSGIAVNGNEHIEYKKLKGRLSVLENYLKEKPLVGNVGIGHTRWATHGAPSDVNSHPHLNEQETIAVVHNGIIENYSVLKEELIKKGYKFKSQTDTEVVVHLLDSLYDGDLLSTVFKATERLRGAYALGVISSDNPDELVAVRKESPLVVGVGNDESFIASDIPALLKYTKDVYFLENGEIVHLTKDKVKIYDKDKNEVEREMFTVDWDIEAASKGGYDHFMLKEIYEQPKAIRETLLRRLDDNGRIVLDDINVTKEDLDKISKIYIVACGTAYHAGLVGRYAIERFAKIPVEPDVASEFRYREPFIDENTLLIAVSQSGETADTLAAIREAKSKGARILSITNVVGSSVARESDDVFYTWAGPEIAVASTKAYTTQLVALYMVALHMANIKKSISEDYYFEIIEKMKALPDKVEEIFQKSDEIKKIAGIIKDKNSAFYIGRGLDYQTSMEGALKLKEISYIHTEAFAAGELKHGTIALIEKETPVIAVASQDYLYEKMVSNIQEVKARGAYTIAIVKEGLDESLNHADETIYIPEVDNILAPVLTVVPTQLLAYYTSVIKGNDVDKPRNLAKSVTVE
ncbi:glutamine--fructose-6-phosphate transaminase (isomerizing) [Tissierella carlieri]|jgi:glucosamine--fructose-6-phosphate aminotransferase (isomerizing)|uniref:glutamine--fructose-6-phosphate transaminase (isomerizing) n=1 Tax=Tissierella TaxID=41273 RepID=UPI001C112BF8|nr:glutamine--fructose-6-phosphate transaminase (isomerizing) [Tissierella carlieri]MBU5312103.1 glutamine--fructose-6-phosphate transaminase (isomerizing) [Tissierella carlieri]MDU5080985.1 glutamine--fructose-6-phosphate transaminase (isomerizing) [Bacillota bacterium]